MSGIIEEYQELRNELRLMLDRREKVRNFAYTIALGVLGLAFSKDIVNPDYSPIILLSGAFCIFSLWYDEIRRMKAIFRIATYIEHYTEKKLNQMHWETWGSRHSIQKDTIGRALANLDLAILGFILLFFGSKLLSDINLKAGLIAGGILLLIAFFIASRAVQLLKGGRAAEMAGWIRIQNKLKAENTVIEANNGHV